MATHVIGTGKKVRGQYVRWRYFRDVPARHRAVLGRTWSETFDHGLSYGACLAKAKELDRRNGALIAKLDETPAEDREAVAFMGGLEAAADRQARLRVEPVLTGAQDLVAYAYRKPLPYAGPGMVDVLIDDWRKARKVTDKHAALVRTLVQRFADCIGDRPVAAVTPAHVVKWVDAMGGTYSAAKYLRLVAFLFDVQRARLRIAVNPFDGIPAHQYTGPRKAKKERIRGADAKRALTTLTGADRLGWRMMLFCGLRAAEACQLRFCDVIEIDGIWGFDIKAEIAKTPASIRFVPVHPSLVAELMATAEAVDDDNALILGQADVRPFQKRGNRLLRDLGVPGHITLHGARKQFRYALGRNNVHEDNVNWLCGWADNTDMSTRYNDRPPYAVLAAFVAAADPLNVL